MANVITEQGDLGLGVYDCDDKVYNEAVREDAKTNWSPRHCDSERERGKVCSCGDTEFKR